MRAQPHTHLTYSWRLGPWQPFQAWSHIKELDTRPQFFKAFTSRWAEGTDPLCEIDRLGRFPNAGVLSTPQREEITFVFPQINQFI